MCSSLTIRNAVNSYLIYEKLTFKSIFFDPVFIIEFMREKAPKFVTELSVAFCPSVLKFSLAPFRPKRYAYIVTNILAHFFSKFEKKPEMLNFLV
jgi:hypothetical protein